MLGISPSAWEEAQTVLGETQAAVVVACILQRGTTIRSAGGYLRGLTRKAEVGESSRRTIRDFFQKTEAI
jgi:replication initiation protein RepC